MTVRHSPELPTQIRAIQYRDALGRQRVVWTANEADAFDQIYRLDPEATAATGRVEWS